MRLEDKAIIVTGAAGGLGRQYAIRFAKEGAKLTVADIQDTTQTAALCRAEGADVLALRVDVSSEDEMQDMAKQTNEKYDRIDGLLNNAGMMRGLEVKSILDVDMETWDRVFAVNARGTFLGVRSVFPYMREQRSGTIVERELRQHVAHRSWPERDESALRRIEVGDYGHHARRRPRVGSVQHQRRNGSAGFDDVGQGGAAERGRSDRRTGGIAGAPRRPRMTSPA